MIRQNRDAKLQLFWRAAGGDHSCACMCAAEASSELIKQCIAHDHFREAFERVKRDRGDRQRQQCCLIDLSRVVRSAAAGGNHEELMQVMADTCSLYAAPPTRPPFRDADAALDAREAEIAAHLLLVIRLDDDLQHCVAPCAHLLRRLKPVRRVFIDVAALGDIISIHGDTISTISRPWTTGTGLVAEWLPYLAEPLIPAALAVGEPAKWNSIYIDVSECTAETKWELLEHLLLLRDLKRLRLESSCYICWFSRANGQDSLYLNFSHFLRGVLKAFASSSMSYPTLRFLCLARAWCQLRDNAITDALKFMSLLPLATTAGDWIMSAAADGDARRFAISPDELQSILIRGYVEVIAPRQRLRESSEIAHALHASGGSPMSPRMPHAVPRPLPSRGIVQPMNYLEAVRGPAGSGKHPAYAVWQLAAYEAVWHVQVQLMAHGYLRLPSAQLPPPPTLESIRALNMREIEIQSRRERQWHPLEDR